MLQLDDATNPVHKEILVMLQNSKKFKDCNITNCLKLSSDKDTPSQFFHSDFTWSYKPTISMDVKNLSIWFGLTDGIHFIDVLSWHKERSMFHRTRCGFPKGKGLLFNTLHAGSASQYEDDYNRENNSVKYSSSRYFAEVQNITTREKKPRMDSVIITYMRK